MNELNIEQKQQNNRGSGDELDIFELVSRFWQAIASFFVGIKNIVVYFLIFTIRNFIWISSFALMGLLLGFLYSSFVKKTFYTSFFEGFSGGVDNVVVINYINQLERIVSKPEILANHLNITIEQAQNVHFIKAFYGIDVNFDGQWDYIDENDSSIPRNLNDTVLVRVPSVFFIKLQLYDESALPVLSDRLLQYINENPHIRSLYEIDRHQKEIMIAELGREINRIDRLDSLQHYRFDRDKGQQTLDKIFLVGSNERELQLFFEEIIELQRKKQELEKLYSIANQPAIVVQDFVAAQWVEKTIMYHSIRFAFVMMLLGYTVAICWTYRKKILKIIAEIENI